MTTYLAHDGILGMRWGVRRYQNKDGTLTEAGKIRYNATNKRRYNARKKAVEKRKDSPKKKVEQESKVKSNADNPPVRNISALTNDELQSAITRAELERKYLNTVKPETIEKGKSYGQQVLTKFGSRLVDNLVDGSARAISNKIIEGLFGKQSNNDKKK